VDVEVVSGLGAGDPALPAPGRRAGSMQCPNCATELPDTAKFCLECGRDLRPRAGFASPAAYTPKHLAERILTTRAALEGERKQVTVVFCDIANSTPLAERVGPERMHALLNGFFELALAEVHRYEGTINQFLGDGFMALFGAPLAHEDDARRAVRAAVAIRRALRDRGSYAGLGPALELAVRIGVNTGLVVVGSIGDNLRMDYTAVGDTTNVAARLQQAAAPGEIVLAEATARLVRSDVRLAAAGALGVKGRSEPVVAYKVLGLAPTRSAFERAAERAFGRFVGRDAELRRLGAIVAEAQAGAGRFVRVVGEAGSGKSRLLYELRRTLGAAEMTTLEARCRSYGATIPYLPILDLVRGQCGIEELDPPDTMAHKVRGTLTALDLDADDRGPFLLRLLGIKDGTDALDDLASEVVRERTLEALRRLLLEGGRRRPLLVVLEDLHWIDDASEEYLVTLVEGLTASPVLIVATHRPDWRPRRPSPGAEEITLAPLGEEDSLTLLEAVVARARLPAALLRIILDRASGNPLFLEELARAVTEQGDPAATGTVPDTLRAVLSARLDRLPDALKRLLQTAAVLGREFPRRLLDAVWDGPGSLAAHLAELARLDFLHELSAGDDPAFAFNHALTQEVAYESLLTPHRQTLHETAARALEAGGEGRVEREWERLAYHWTRTARADKAVNALSRVAARALAAYANADAVAALREAEIHAERLTTDRERITLKLVLERSQAQFLLGQVQESVADVKACASLVARVGDPSLTAQYHFRIASGLGVLGDSPGAIEHAGRALEEARRAGDVAAEGKAQYILSRESFWSGDLVAGVEHGRHAVVLLERAGERWWLAMAHWARALSYVLLGRFDDALDSLMWSQTLADKLRDARLASQAAWTRGWIHATRGDWATGIEAGRRALELAPDDMTRALAEGFLGASHLERGDTAAALPLLESATVTFGRLHFRQLEGWFTILQAHAHVVTGDTERAAALVAGGAEIVRGVTFAPAIVEARVVEALVARARRQPAEAERMLQEAVSMAERLGARFFAARQRLTLAELAGARGDRATLARELATAHAEFQALGAPVWAARAADAGANRATSVSG
jgi:class 3 adenylate cyclase/tetratricopeptide (TPR) repeat protein